MIPKAKCWFKEQDTDMNAQHQPTGSAYFLTDLGTEVETHTLSVVVTNEPGVLARVIGLFSGRGYNIDSLTVSETQHEKHLSRITIVTTGLPAILEQIRHQLDRLVPVHQVADLDGRRRRSAGARACAGQSGRHGRSAP
jgi:acetolactate synthase-1/3 small subunit